MAPITKPAQFPAPTAAPFSAAGTASPTFPTAALGPMLSSAITAVAARTQASVELVAHHTLTLAAMAVQRLISIRLPTGVQRPVSCFFVSLVGAGEGRGAAEKAVVDTVRLWEREFEEEFPKRVVAHVDQAADSGVQRPAPLQHLNLFDDYLAPLNDDRYRSSARQAGLFARHPHDLLQPGPHRRQEARSLCAVWNGKVIQRVLGAALFPRLSVHLVATPRAGHVFLSDPEAADAGLLGRALVVAPASRIGARTFAAADSDDPPPAFETLLAYLGELYAKHPTMDARVIAFSKEAASLWLSYAQETESAMADGGALAPIRAFAGYLPEHAARLAAVIAFMDDCALADVGAAHLRRGIALARFYAAERLRLQHVAPVALSDDEKEELLKEWLAQRPKGEGVSLRDVCRLGPPQVRNADTAYKLMRRMERLGIVQPANPDFGGATAPRRVGNRYAWRVPGEVSQSVA